MPSRSPSAHRRRNPDPQTLRDYRADAFADALARTGRFNVEQRFGGQDLLVSIRDLKVRLEHFKDSNAWWAEGWRSESVEPSPLKARRESLELFNHINETAEQLGEVLLWAGFVPKENLIKPSEDYRVCVFLPSSVKDRLAAAQAALTTSTLFGHELPIAAASVKLAKALAESQPMLAAVPKKYRKQITALLQQAFENDDLAAYEHAQHLAELVSE